MEYGVKGLQWIVEEWSERKEGGVKESATSRSERGKLKLQASSYKLPREQRMKSKMYERVHGFVV